MTDGMFFTPSRRLTVAEIAVFGNVFLLQPELSSTVISRLASLENSDRHSLVFFEGRKNQFALASLVAGAIFCSADFVDKVPQGIAILVSQTPQRDFIRIAHLLYPDAITPDSLIGVEGISPFSYIHPTARLEEGVTVEAGAVIGKNVEIGARSLICANVVISKNCKIGRDCYIGPSVSLQYACIGNSVHLHSGVRIGQDGFGYLPDQGKLEKVPQLGLVIIQDFVEIGANTTIDRGTLTDTIIGEGTKIDNLVQIAHNVRIGRHCLIAAHCGISGSCVIGDGTMLGGRVGLADHLTIGSRVQIAAASGVMNDIPDGEKWGGIPARPFKQWFREVAALRNIVKLGKNDKI